MNTLAKLIKTTTLTALLQITIALPAMERSHTTSTNNISQGIKQSESANAGGLSSDSALHSFASTGYSQAVEILILNHANVNTTNFYSSTPLHVASFHGHNRVVETLIAYNANVNPINSAGT